MIWLLCLWFRYDWFVRTITVSLKCYRCSVSSVLAFVHFSTHSYYDNPSCPFRSVIFAWLVRTVHLWISVLHSTCRLLNLLQCEIFLCWSFSCFHPVLCSFFYSSHLTFCFFCSRFSLSTLWVLTSQVCIPRLLQAAKRLSKQYLLYSD